MIYSSGLLSVLSVLMSQGLIANIRRVDGRSSFVNVDHVPLTLWT